MGGYHILAIQLKVYMFFRVVLLLKGHVIKIGAIM